VKKSFTSKSKLRTDEDFAKIFSNTDNLTKKIKSQYLSLIFRPNELSYPRIGISISKKNIAKATSRNRLRRIVRESFRQKQHLIGNFDIILIAYKNADQLTNKSWCTMINQELAKL
jgi:ribonuclease P protein component